jgi:hypothetical protein
MCHSEVDKKLQMRRVHMSLIKAAGIDLAKLVLLSTELMPMTSVNYVKLSKETTY